MEIFCYPCKKFGESLDNFIHLVAKFCIHCYNMVPKWAKNGPDMLSIIQYKIFFCWTYTNLQWKFKPFHASKCKDIIEKAKPWSEYGPKLMENYRDLFSMPRQQKGLKYIQHCVNGNISHKTKKILFCHQYFWYEIVLS